MATKKAADEPTTETTDDAAKDPEVAAEQAEPAAEAVAAAAPVSTAIPANFEDIAALGKHAQDDEDTGDDSASSDEGEAEPAASDAS